MKIQNKIKLKPKKSLGQNFLKSVPALNKIVEAGEIKDEDVILEIGPGKGALTQKLLEKSSHVIAVEKDNELFSFLQNKFQKEIEEKKLILINDDILKFEIQNDILIFFHGLAGIGTQETEDLTKTSKSSSRFLPYKIIANIPYNITGAILKKFLTAEVQPSLMVLMVQNEVAKRIIANDKKESILSISVKAYGDPKLVMKVSARYFSPSPKVDSAVISIKNISRKKFTHLHQNSPLEEYPKGEVDVHPVSDYRATPQEGNINEEKFWQIVKAGFAHKRKKLSSNLKSLKLNYEGDASVSYEYLGNKRAEDLSLDDWIKLAE